MHVAFCVCSTKHGVLPTKPVTPFQVILSLVSLSSLCGQQSVLPQSLQGEGSVCLLGVQGTL